MLSPRGDKFPLIGSESFNAEPESRYLLDIPGARLRRFRYRAEFSRHHRADADARLDAGG